MIRCKDTKEPSAVNSVGGFLFFLHEKETKEMSFMGKEEFIEAMAAAKEEEQEKKGACKHGRCGQGQRGS